MRWLAYLAMIALAIAGAIFGPAAISSRQQPAPARDLTWTSGAFRMVLTARPCPADDLREPLEEWGVPPARVFIATQTGRPDVNGCWVFDIAGDILIADRAGLAGDLPIPRERFRRG